MSEQRTPRIDAWIHFFKDRGGLKDYINQRLNASAVFFSLFDGCQPEVSSRANIETPKDAVDFFFFFFFTYPWKPINFLPWENHPFRTWRHTSAGPYAPTGVCWIDVPCGCGWRRSGPIVS